VVSSYGIACAEFVHPGVFGAPAGWVGLSWVAVWILIFNIVMPTVPRYAMIAALMSITSVPAMVTISLAVFPSPIVPTGFELFLAFVFPYLLVVVMAYVGVRIVYALGVEVKRARDLGSYRLE